MAKGLGFLGTNVLVEHGAISIVRALHEPPELGKCPKVVSGGWPIFDLAHLRLLLPNV